VERDELTDESFWDDYWASVRLPLEIKKTSSYLIGAITDVLDRFLTSHRHLSVLEIGGAPGQYAAYVHRGHGHAISVLDSSPIGCAKARENFDQLGIPAHVMEGDMFAPPAGLGSFDAVYSLGVIEHFPDVSVPVAAHVDYVKPGGLVILGVPNLRGVNALVLKRLSPSFLGMHNLKALELEQWDRFEEDLRLTRLFRGYIGGFDASTFWRCESRRIIDRAIHQVLWYVARALELPGTGFLRKANGRVWSGYLMGVYRVAY
jgi:SAM-dependent methyltransferase